MLLVCKEHVELALDIIVDECEKAPELVTLEQAGIPDGNPSPTCCCCEARAEYVVR